MFKRLREILLGKGKTDQPFQKFTGTALKDLFDFVEEKKTSDRNKIEEIENDFESLLCTVREVITDKVKEHWDGDFNWVDFHSEEKELGQGEDSRRYKIDYAMTDRDGVPVPIVTIKLIEGQSKAVAAAFKDRPISFFNRDYNENGFYNIDYRKIELRVRFHPAERIGVNPNGL